MAYRHTQDKTMTITRQDHDKATDRKTREEIPTHTPWLVVVCYCLSLRWYLWSRTRFVNHDLESLRVLSLVLCFVLPYFVFLLYTRCFFWVFFCESPSRPTLYFPTDLWKHCSSPACLRRKRFRSICQSWGRSLLQKKNGNNCRCVENGPFKRYCIALFLPVSSSIYGFHTMPRLTALSYLISNLILYCLFLSSVVLSRLALSDLISSHRSYLTSSYLISFDLILISYLQNVEADDKKVFGIRSPPLLLLPEEVAFTHVSLPRPPTVNINKDKSLPEPPPSSEKAVSPFRAQVLFSLCKCIQKRVSPFIPFRLLLSLSFPISWTHLLGCVLRSLPTFPFLSFTFPQHLFWFFVLAQG